MEYNWLKTLREKLENYLKLGVIIVDDDDIRQTSYVTIIDLLILFSKKEISVLLLYTCTLVFLIVK